METTIETFKFLAERGKPLRLLVDQRCQLPNGKMEYTLRKDSGEELEVTGSQDLHTEIDSLRLRLRFYPGTSGWGDTPSRTSSTYR